MGVNYSFYKEINRTRCCTLHFSLFSQLLQLLTVSSTVLMLPLLLLPHGKYPSKRVEAISAEDPSSPLDTSCLPATANKAAQFLLLWEPSTLTNQNTLSPVHSNAIQTGTPT